MRSQVFDESANFTCRGCTACCDQPWRTSIEADKAHRLDQHDFSAYPQLRNVRFYREPADGREGVYDLAKGEGTKCLFLDADGLCIIHKELGPQAKPNMCRQFPLLPSRTWVEDRISANYGCPCIQDRCGTPLAEQRSEVAEVVPLSTRPANPDGPIVLDATTKLTQAEGKAFFDRALAIFDERTDTDLWRRFAELLVLLSATGELKSQSPNDPRQVIDRLSQPAQLPDGPPTEPIRAYASLADAPMAARFLFAATLYPDTVPTNSAGAMGFLQRLARIPKLMALAQMSGGYPSRVLGRNVHIGEVMQHKVAEELPPSATRLLARYYRSRLWQQFPAGTRLPVVAGVHQHIQDLNAIIFLARAEACRKNESELTEPLIRKTLTRVEFHLANQPRLYDHTLKGWLKSQLGSLALACRSLRLMALHPAPQPAPVSRTN